MHDRVTTPFGERVVSLEQASLPLAFPGQREDAETGLSYNWHRDYDPGLGRYVQSDPIGLAGGVSTYGYANQNPVSYIDPTGEFGVAGALIGGGVDLGMQLLMNGGRLECVSWTQVGVAGALGAVSGGFAGGAFKHAVSGKRWADASKKWSNVSRRYRRAQERAGNAPQGDWDAHHWLFPRGGQSGPSWRNQPWNLNPMPRNAHRRMHGGDDRFGYAQRWWHGTPPWAKAGQGSLAGGAAGDLLDDHCGC